MNRLARVKALKAHRHSGVTYGPGAEYTIPRHKLVAYAGRGWVRLVESSLSWHDLPGRELRITPTGVHPPPVVACCCIWDHANAFAVALPTWLPGIDALVVADGPYRDTGHRGPSSDHLRDVLAKCPVPVHEVPWDKVCWSDQPTKRTALLKEASRLYPNATLVILDADELLSHAQVLREFGADVGWVQVTSPLYNRPADQPRLFRAHPELHYDQRHHWLYRGDQFLASHQYGGTGVLHQLVPVHLHNERNMGLSQSRLQAKHRYSASRSLRESGARVSPQTAKSDQSLTGRETLRILQVANYDVGLVIYRLHTAINCTTPHASVFGVQRSMNPFHVPSQYQTDNRDGRVKLQELARDADVVHCHLNYFPIQQLRLPGGKPIVIHHHGTMFRRSPSTWASRDRQAALRLVSNLELLQYGTDLHWLPNPMPVAEYRRLRKGYVPGPVFRLGHSPSRRLRKATDVLIAVVKELQKQGLKIELVLMEGMRHEQVIRTKATCDALFDSFSLGIQCSGLEAAAMEMPVIAGDSHVAKEYRERLGAVPYTYANEANELKDVIERLVTDQDYRQAEAARVSTYCVTFHDEAAVALRYLDLLDNAISWRSGHKMGRVPA
jgi:hypothetical protein